VAHAWTSFVEKKIERTNGIRQLETMPVLSRFYGLVVFMNYREHNPPHFHARYQGFEVSVEIESGVVTGHMPTRALKLLFEWAELH
jgi:hypothetical protein